MSSGTQIDMDWAGIDGAAGETSAPPVGGGNGAGTGTEKFLTDEEILEIESVGESRTTSRDVIPSGARNPSGNFAGGESQQRDSSGKSSPRNDDVAGAPRNGDVAGVPNPQNGSASAKAAANAMPEWMAAAAGDPTHGVEAQLLWQEHQAFRAAFSSPAEARAIKELFPGGAQEAQTLRQAAQAVDQLDAAIYSGDARAQSEVVAELARANPAAFRQLFSEAAKVLAGLGQALPVAMNQAPGVSAAADETWGTRASAGQASAGNNQTPTLRENREGWGTQQHPTTQHSVQQHSTQRHSTLENYDSQLGYATPARNFPGSEDPGYNNAQAPSPALSAGEPAATGHPSHSLRASESQQSNYQAPITNHDSRFTNHNSPDSNHESRITSRSGRANRRTRFTLRIRSGQASHKSPVTSHRNSILGPTRRLSVLRMRLLLAMCAGPWAIRWRVFCQRELLMGLRGALGMTFSTKFIARWLLIGRCPTRLAKYCAGRRGSLLGMAGALEWRSSSELPRCWRFARSSWFQAWRGA